MDFSFRDFILERNKFSIFSLFPLHGRSDYGNSIREHQMYFFLLSFCIYYYSLWAWGKWLQKYVMLHFLRILGYFARNISLKQLKNWTWIIIIKDHFVQFSLWFHEQFSIWLRRFSSHFISYSRHTNCYYEISTKAAFSWINEHFVVVGEKIKIFTFAFMFWMDLTR